MAGKVFSRKAVSHADVPGTGIKDQQALEFKRARD